MSQLHDRLRVLAEDVLVPLIEGRAEKLCLIDPPDYPNAGDHAILIGEMEFLTRRFPHAPLQMFDSRSMGPDADEAIGTASLLLLQGGGNFGDLWPHHHAFRLSILERFPQVPKIQLAQSVHFTSPDMLSRTAQLIAQQKDFTMLVRDRRSLDFAQTHFQCRAILCPDMAFLMNARRRLAPSLDVLALLRTDKEIAADHGAVLAALGRSGLRFEVADWIASSDSFVVRADERLSRYRRRHRLTGFLARLPVLVRMRHAQERLAVAIKTLSRGRLVMTDRLHGHVISTILGLPQIVFDSFDGKVSALHEAWTQDAPGVHFVRQGDEIADLLRVAA